MFSLTLVGQYKLNKNDEYYRIKLPTYCTRYYSSIEEGTGEEVEGPSAGKSLSLPCRKAGANSGAVGQVEASGVGDGDGEA